MLNDSCVTALLFHRANGASGQAWDEQQQDD